MKVLHEMIWFPVFGLNRAGIFVKKLNNQTDAVQENLPDPGNEIREISDESNKFR